MFYCRFNLRIFRWCLSSCLERGLKSTFLGLFFFIIGLATTVGETSSKISSLGLKLYYVIAISSPNTWRLSLNISRISNLSFKCKFWMIWALTYRTPLLSEFIDSIVWYTPLQKCAKSIYFTENSVSYLALISKSRRNFWKLFSLIQSLLPMRLSIVGLRPWWKYGSLQ